MKKILGFILMTSFVTMNSYGQLQIGYNFDQFVKQPDDFVSRMNEVKSEPDSAESISKYFDLFHKDTTTLANIDEVAAMTFWSTLRKDKDSLNLSYRTSDWIAELHCEVSFNESIYPIKLYFNLHYDQKLHFVNWSIVSADITSLKKDSTRAIAITGENHNMDFFQVDKILSTSPSSLAEMVHSDYDIDDLSYLVALFNLELVELKSRHMQTMYYNNYLGYNVVIEDKIVEGNFHSWGITNIERITQ